jgi:hypothetical protein
MINAHLRRWRRSIKRRLKLNRADVVFLSPAKSGRTWVRAMQSHVYHHAYGTPLDLIDKGEAFHRIDPRVPRFFFSHRHSEAPLVLSRLVPERLLDRIVVGMLRDPRDVATSLYHQLRHRSGQAQRPNAAARAARELDLCAFMQDQEFGLAAVIRNIDAIASFAGRHPRFHLLRYEALRADPLEEFSRYLAALGHDFPRELVADAVEFTRFENLKQREAEGFFRSPILQPTDALEPSSFKVRRGKVAGYRDELTDDQIAAVDAIVDAHLSPGLGYRSDERATTPWRSAAYS